MSPEWPFPLPSTATAEWPAPPPTTPRRARPRVGRNYVNVELFTRGFELARRYEAGERLTAKRVRELFGVSQATAVRDLAAVRMILYGADFRSHPAYAYGSLCKRKDG